MVNKEMFEQQMKSNGFNYSILSQQLGIAEFTLRRKVANENEFVASELHKLKKLLKIRTNKMFDRIFYSE